MGHNLRTARALALAAIGVSAVSLAGMIGIAGDAEAANSKPKAAAPAAAASDADQQKAAAAAARQSYEAGIKSYASGKFQPAVDQLTSALRGGGLASPEMAKALYTRGLAYKKLSKPGLAISDLTSALWLKNGLGEADQKIAMSERSEAYRMAGLGEGNSGSEKVSVADPNPAPAGVKAPSLVADAAPATPAAKPVKGSKAVAAPVAIAPATGPVAEVTRQSPDSEAAREAAAARKLAAAPVDVNGIQGAVSNGLAADAARTATPVQTATASQTVPVASAPPTMPSASGTPTVSAPFAVPGAPAAPVLAAAPMEGVAPVAAPQSTSGPSTVSSFFSNIFGGGTSSTAAAPQSASSVTTASTSPSAAGTSNWAETTSVASGAKKVAAATPAPAPAAAKMTPGKYKLHIAAVRSRAEAEALAQKLASQQGAALKSRLPVVDEAVIGSMGTFYRVRVGSFATPDESRGICNSLRSSGFDCLVVTN